MNTIVEYRLRAKLTNTDADEFLMKIESDVVPNVGEVVNINGEPYIVFERGLAISNDSPITHVYVHVTSPYGRNVNEEARKASAIKKCP